MNTVLELPTPSTHDQDFPDYDPIPQFAVGDMLGSAITEYKQAEVLAPNHYRCQFDITCWCTTDKLLVRYAAKYPPTVVPMAQMLALAPYDELIVEVQGP